MVLKFDFLFLILVINVVVYELNKVLRAEYISSDITEMTIAVPVLEATVLLLIVLTSLQCF